MVFAIKVSLLAVANKSDPINGTVVTYLNQTTLAWINITLSPGENWTSPFTFTVNSVGVWQVRFELFADGNFSSAYRRVWFYTKVG